MPAYFSMTLQFLKSRIKPHFVEQIYSCIIASGFPFKSGYCCHDAASLEEIIEWNQRRLERGFRLGYSQHVKYDYMQLLFDSSLYSEFRGFWMYLDEEVAFELIIPESSILNKEGGDRFIGKKLSPVRNLAVTFWEHGLVDAVQTSLECDGMTATLQRVHAGEDISIRPFAILGLNSFRSFQKGFFDEMNICRLKSQGILAESREATL